MIEPMNEQISLSRQCELIGISRSGWYYQPVEEDAQDLLLKRLLDEQYTRVSFYGSRRMTVWLRKQGYAVNRKRVSRLMQEMGIEALYPKPRTTELSLENKIYPYLLRGVVIDHPNQVWSADITYIRLRNGFLYLVAILDWLSRYVLAWELSNTLETYFC
jgi:putative transposase